MRFGLFGSAQARRGDGDPARGFRDYVEASSPEPVLVAPTSDPEIRVCEVCKKPITGRAEKRVCSGRCRIIACRARRHGALLDRLRAAEDALALAASAVAALRQLAEQGPHVTASLAA